MIAQVLILSSFLNRRLFPLDFNPMASLVGKKKGRNFYYIIVGSARLNGKPQIARQTYLGTTDSPENQKLCKTYGEGKLKE